MFKDSSTYILSTENNVYRLEIDKETQKSINELFSQSVNLMVDNKNCRDFEVNYKPENDEILRIENFLLQDYIKDAIRNPLGSTLFEKDTSSDKRKDSENSGYPDYGIGITNTIDCYYSDGDLKFNSFYFARQVFDLNSYYRSASDSEVTEFTNNSAMIFESTEDFNSIANTYVRRKIAMINDSNVLKQYSASQIKKRARNYGIDIEIRDDKVVMPAEKESAMEVLAFLDEEAYRGPFSNDLLLANSKRVLRKG